MGSSRTGTRARRAGRSRRGSRSGGPGNGWRRRPDEPLCWVDSGRLARRWPRIIVRDVIAEELATGRVQSDGHGKLRIRPGAFEKGLLRAIELIELPEPV